MIGSNPAGSWSLGMGTQLVLDQCAGSCLGVVPFSVLRCCTFPDRVLGKLLVLFGMCNDGGLLLVLFFSYCYYYYWDKLDFFSGTAMNCIS
jgi:hypothetical protein